MSEQMMEEDDDSDFNVIKPTLLQQLKTILDQYPDDGQILKELIQNAEDAGATEVKFLYDKNSYSAEKLYNTSLAKFQGPALYAYNDAQFTKDDWEGIRKIYDSNKVKDPMKVGRFGLGFKSVFHLTGRPITIKPCGKTGDREHPPFTRGLLGLCYEYIGEFFAESMT